MWNNDEGNRQNSRAQDAVCWAQHKANRDTIVKIILWEPTYGRTSRGRSALGYVEVLKSDVGVTDPEELIAFMKEGAEWRVIKSRSLSTR